MVEDRLARVISLYESRGTLERIEGDATGAAETWLIQARAELPGVQTLIEDGLSRLAYNAAYDIMRHAAEAIVAKAGGRVAATQGAHEAVFAIADALVGSESPGVFAAQRATPTRQKRHSFEYLDVEHPSGADPEDARQALQWATEAIEAAEPFVARSSVPRI